MIFTYWIRPQFIYLLDYISLSRISKIKFKLSQKMYGFINLLELFSSVWIIYIGEMLSLM